MDGLGAKKYLQTSRKRFDPIALLVSVSIIIFVFFTISGDSSFNILDIRSFVVVFGGTIAILLFQFDFSSVYTTLKIIGISLLGTPDKHILQVLRQLDEAIMGSQRLTDLRQGSEVNGEMLNDICYMVHQKLLFEEIDEFITSRIKDEYLERQVAVDLLKKGGVISPALGLFGTVVGLIGVLQSLADPSNIGPSMSLALLTTAYGAGIGSLIFTPLAGRMEHHNVIYLEVHKQLLSKVAILIRRDEREMSHEWSSDKSTL